MARKKLRRRNPDSRGSVVDWEPTKKQAATLAKCIEEAGWHYYDVSWLEQTNPKKADKRYLILCKLYVVSGKLVFGEIDTENHGETDSLSIKSVCEQIVEISRHPNQGKVSMYKHPQPLAKTRKPCRKKRRK